jgi:two-component system, NtrC family, nitrogen regulation sensor histidine kinase NtrY
MSSSSQHRWILGGAFSWRLGWRVAAMMLLLILVALCAREPNTYATMGLLLAATGALFVSLVRVVQRGNAEVARLIDALAQGDFSPAFRGGPQDAGFAELGAAMERLLAGVQAGTAKAKADAQHWRGVVEHLPIALISIDSHGGVEFLNTVARRWFRVVDATPRSAMHARSAATDALRAALKRTDASFAAPLLDADGAVFTARIAQAPIMQHGRSQRLVAMQPIQSDLDAHEAAVSRGLVRVLTHEIMNSLTPVTSLAQSASQLAQALPDETKSGKVYELRTALATLHRRADALQEFALRYRALTASPSLAKREFLVQPWLAEIEAVFCAEWPPNTLDFELRTCEPETVLCADRALLEQALFNLLRNAAQACTAHALTVSEQRPRVRLTTRRSQQGGLMIDIDDNGGGIATAIAADVFLPFFTSKTSGSGIGLALAKQIVIAHGGRLHTEASTLGGARFRMALP